MTDTLPFGKYATKHTISEIIDTDFRYIKWLNTNELIKFTPDVLQKVKIVERKTLEEEFFELMSQTPTDMEDVPY
jgi:peptide subunit release factor 1 (eRF1)